MHNGPATNRLTSTTRAHPPAATRLDPLARDASSRSRCRSTNFCTLPLGVRGNSSTDAHLLGPLLAREARGFEVRPHRGERRSSSCPACMRKNAARVLAEPRVGRRDHRDLGDARHAHEQLLDLLRAHVLAAADDDVLLAIGDREVAVGVEHADVAGHEPAVGVERASVVRRGSV